MSQRLNGTQPVLEVDSLRKLFHSRSVLSRASRVIPAVDGVSFRLGRGRTTALVGESGCGKSTLARLILHLHRPDSGRIVLLGDEVQGLSERRFRPFRRHVQMVFQNPLASFDPMYTLGASIGEVMRLRPQYDDTRARTGDLLTEVGLSPRFARLKPHAVSGGELQRAAIARALAAHPDLVVMDEPTSALDMSIQGQVLSLMTELQARRSLSYLIATHDLRAVRLVADEVIVMYLGQVVESGPTEEIFARPRHPYTRGLFYASDLAGRTEERDRTVRIRGTLRYPDPGYRGCRLVGRCPLALERCREPQELTQLTPGHLVRCWRAVAGEIEGGAFDGAREVREPGRNG
jgi:oligopeptide/dipeptide ABC transporter ATP-binding protein